MEEFLLKKKEEIDKQIDILVARKLVIDDLINEYSATKIEETATEEVVPYGFN